MYGISRWVALTLVMAIVLGGCFWGDDDDDVAENGAFQPTPSPMSASPSETPAPTPTLPPWPTPTAEPSPEPESEPEPEFVPDFAGVPFAFGWNVGLRADDLAEEHNNRTAQVVQESGFGWVRFQMEWQTFERADGEWNPLPMDRRIDAMHANGLNILIVLAKAPEWAMSPEPDRFLADYGKFERFAEFVADRYQGKVQAWQIWNEPNYALEFGGDVDAAEYVELVIAGANGIRRADPNALIVAGAPTPTGVNDRTIAIDDAVFLEQMYQYNDGIVRDYFDIMGIHLNSTHNAPDHTWPDNVGPHQGWNDHPSFFFRRGEELRDIMVRYDDANKPVWITEFGWTTENQAPGRGYGVNNSEDDVAQYLTRALEIATQEWEWCTGAFVWNLNWSTLVEPDHHMFPSASLRQDWSPRPSFEAMRNFPKE